VTGLVRTVLGDLDSRELGATYCHEHLLVRPPAHLADPDLVLDDEEKAAEELAAFRAVGGGAIVDVTTAEWGRDAEGLGRLSERASVAIVAATGHVAEDSWRGALDLAGLSDDLVRELTDGMEGTGIKAGVIKVGSSLDGLTSAERALFRAAAEAQRWTGAPITTHTTAGTAALDQARTLAAAGADLSHVCIGHLDRRLDWDEHLELARAGVFLGYDCVSKEHYALDAERARFVARLVELGFGDRICLSGDLARRSYLEAWGGAPGYRHILSRFLPLLRSYGLDEAAVRALVVENPARFLTWG
jgi:phosphotriesterase-related protein